MILGFVKKVFELIAACRMRIPETHENTGETWKMAYFVGLSV